VKYIATQNKDEYDKLIKKRKFDSNECIHVKSAGDLVGATFRDEIYVTNKADEKLRKAVVNIGVALGLNMYV